MSLPNENLKHVALRHDQVVLLRLLHGTIMEASIANLQRLSDKLTSREFVETMASHFKLYRGLDDLLLGGIQLMSEGGDAVDFSFTPKAYSYLLAIAQRQWEAGDFIICDGPDAERYAQLANENRDDVVLSLKACSKQRLQNLLPSDASA